MKRMCAMLREWITPSSLRNALPAFLFQLWWLLKQYAFLCNKPELADKNVKRDLGVFIKGNVHGYSICPSKNYKPKSKLFGVQKISTKWCVTVKLWITVSSQTFFAKIWGLHTSLNKPRTARISASWRKRLMKTWMIRAAHKIQDTVNP